MEHVCQPIPEREIVELLDERLPFPPVKKPCPGEACVASGTGWGTLIIANVGNELTTGRIGGVGGVKLETAGAANVSHAFRLKAKGTENRANVGVQLSGFFVVFLPVGQCRRAGQVDDEFQPREDDRTFRDR